MRKSCSTFSRILKALLALLAFLFTTQTGYGYDGNGNPVRETLPGNGGEILRTYDALNRVEPRFPCPPKEVHCLNAQRPLSCLGCGVRDILCSLSSLSIIHVLMGFWQD